MEPSFYLDNSMPADVNMEEDVQTKMQKLSLTQQPENEGESCIDDEKMQVDQSHPVPKRPSILMISEMKTRHMKEKNRGETAQINKTWQEHGDFGEVLQKETFYGIKKLLDLADDPRQPVIFIIKNIKAFNHTVLNDLIHLIKKYRATYGCNMSLMLGVQNNNRDEVYLRINMQNCTKLTIKTFYFPSMKNIILQVI